MSYHVPLAYRRTAPPRHPPVMPLAQVPAPTPGMTVRQKLVVAIVVVVVVLAILWWLDQQRGEKPRRRRRRHRSKSTVEMARNLYERLDSEDG